MRGNNASNRGRMPKNGVGSADTVIVSDDSDGPHPRNRPHYASSSSHMNNRPYGGGMGFSPMAYGGYGMMGMGMGMYGNPMMSMLMGPMNFMYTINYSIMAIGQVCEMIGASSHGLIQLAYTLLNNLKDLEATIRKSAFRRWLQKKSKKSIIFRYLCVLAAMAISFQVSRLLQQLLGGQISRLFGSSSSGTISSAAMAIANGSASGPTAVGAKASQPLTPTPTPTVPP